MLLCRKNTTNWMNCKIKEWWKEEIMVFIIHRARQTGNRMMNLHHPSFSFVSSSLLLHRSLVIHQTVSPLARSLPSLFTLFLPPPLLRRPTSVQWQQLLHLLEEWGRELELQGRKGTYRQSCGHTVREDGGTEDEDWGVKTKPNVGLCVVQFNT